MSTLTIAAVGDSTTAGTPGFKSPLEAPPDGAGNVESQYAHWLMTRRPDWRVLNRGVNGERSDEIRARFARDAEGADIVVLIAGVNDIYQGRTSAAVARELQAMYEAARAADIPLVAGTIIPYNTATLEQNLAMHDINDWIRAQARADSGVIYVDTRAAVASPRDPDRLFSSPDGLHPDAAGYRRMANAIEPAIERALQLRSR